jgi:hypothetical protein
VPHLRDGFIVAKVGSSGAAIHAPLFWRIATPSFRTAVILEKPESLYFDVVCFTLSS